MGFTQSQNKKAACKFGRIEIVGAKFFHLWSEQKISERTIVNPKPETLLHYLKTDEYEKRSKYQQTHILSEATLYISGDATIYNAIFSVCFWKQGEIVGIEIENLELVKIQKSIFETFGKFKNLLQKAFKGGHQGFTFALW